MNDVDVVAEALARRAAARFTDASPCFARDLDISLSEAVRRRLSAGVEGRGARYGLRILDAYESDPGLWQARMVRVLTLSGVNTDEAIVAAARAVLRAEQPRPVARAAETVPRPSGRHRCPRDG